MLIGGRAHAAAAWVRIKPPNGYSSIAAKGGGGYSDQLIYRFKRWKLASTR